MTAEDFISEEHAGQEHCNEGWNDKGERILTTQNYKEAYEAASFCLGLWQGRQSSAVTTVSGGAFETNRRRH
jgi:hypothetical protein